MIRGSPAGSALVLGDNRSAWARRAKDIIAAHIADLGGIENVSNAELSLIHRCAALTTELELLETIFSDAGRATSEQLDLYSRVAGHLRRLLETLGLKRRSKQVGGLTLSDLILQDHIDAQRAKAPPIDVDEHNP